MEPLVEGRRVDDPGRLAGGDHPPGVLGGGRHRLLAQHVLAGGGAGQDGLEVPVVGRGDVDGLDARVVQEGRQARAGRGPPAQDARGQAGRRGRVDVEGRRDPAVGRSLDPGRAVVPGDPAAADDAPAQSPGRRWRGGLAHHHRPGRSSQIRRRTSRSSPAPPVERRPALEARLPEEVGRIGGILRFEAGRGPAGPDAARPVSQDRVRPEQGTGAWAGQAGARPDAGGEVCPSRPRRGHRLGPGELGGAPGDRGDPGPGLAGQLGVVEEPGAGEEAGVSLGGQRLARDPPLVGPAVVRVADQDRAVLPDEATQVRGEPGLPGQEVEGVVAERRAGRRRRAERPAGRGVGAGQRDGRGHDEATGQPELREHDVEAQRRDAPEREVAEERADPAGDLDDRRPVEPVPLQQRQAREIRGRRPAMGEVVGHRPVGQGRHRVAERGPARVDRLDQASERRPVGRGRPGVVVLVREEPHQRPPGVARVEGVQGGRPEPVAPDAEPGDALDDRPAPRARAGQRVAGIPRQRHAPLRVEQPGEARQGRGVRRRRLDHGRSPESSRTRSWNACNGPGWTRSSSSRA